MAKQARNDLCSCGSGQKYKYCCINKKRKEQLIPIGTDPNTGAKVSIDLTNDIFNDMALFEIPLKNFCKDNDLYLFGGTITGEDVNESLRRLKRGVLTRTDLITIYKKHSPKDTVLNLLKMSILEFDCFKKREQILTEAFQAHFDEKYSISIPTLFAQLEGILRDLGNLTRKEKFRSTIPTDIWDQKLLLWTKDDSERFNAFVHKLFEGSQDATFNRNSILHGFNVDYANEQNSLVLILTILEVRNFLWWQSNIEDQTGKLFHSISSKAL